MPYATDWTEAAKAQKAAEMKKLRELTGGIIWTDRRKGGVRVKALVGHPQRVVELMKEAGFDGWYTSKNATMYSPMTYSYVAKQFKF